MTYAANYIVEKAIILEGETESNELNLTRMLPFSVITPDDLLGVSSITFLNKSGDLYTTVTATNDSTTDYAVALAVAKTIPIDYQQAGTLGRIKLAVDSAPTGGDLILYIACKQAH